MQLEFPFVQPFDDAVAAIKKREAEYWGKFSDMLNKFFPNRVSISDIFKDAYWLNSENDNDISIPCVLKLGPVGQYEFEFAKEMTRAYWSNMTVVFDTDETQSNQPIR